MSDTFSLYGGNSPLHDYLDKKTFCAQLGITARTADRWNLLRIGPPRTKAGRKILYRKAAIAEWLQRREQTGVRVGGPPVGGMRVRGDGGNHRPQLARPRNRGESVDGTIPGTRLPDAQLVNPGRA